MCPLGTEYNSLRHGRTNVFCRSNGQRQRKAVLAQSGDRQRSGKRRLRAGKRTAANRRSALRKCRNVVSAGVLSPISSAVGRNGAVGDKESARAVARNYPHRRQRKRSRRGAKLSPSETNNALAPLPLTQCESRTGCAGRFWRLSNRAHCGAKHRNG